MRLVECKAAAFGLRPGILTREASKRVGQLGQTKRKKVNKLDDKWVGGTRRGGHKG